MTTYESLDSLHGMTRQAVVDLLYRLADDEFIIGHRNAEWTASPSPPLSNGGRGGVPILEADATFCSMAQGEIAHAHLYYKLLHQLGEPDPDSLRYGRTPRAFRCASLVSLPKGDWSFSLLRQFLYDSAESVRLSALANSALRPLASVARGLRAEERRHLMHGRSWVVRLGSAAGESHDKMRAALKIAYPHALGLFEPTEADEPLAQTGISPREQELRTEWESAVSATLLAADLRVPDTAEPIHGGRLGRHPEALAELLLNIGPTSGAPVSNAPIRRQ